MSSKVKLEHFTQALLSPKLFDIKTIRLEVFALPSMKGGIVFPSLPPYKAVNK